MTPAGDEITYFIPLSHCAGTVSPAGSRSSYMSKAIIFTPILVLASLLAACECPCAKRPAGEIKPSASTHVYPDFSDSLSRFYAEQRMAEGADEPSLAAMSPGVSAE